MLSDGEKMCILSFLSRLSDEKIKKMAGSIIQGRRKILSRDDGVNTILLHSESVYAVLDNNKVSLSDLQGFLDANQIRGTLTGNKTNLKFAIMDYWSKNGIVMSHMPPAINGCQPNQPAIANTAPMENNNQPLPVTPAASKKPEEMNADEFIFEFCKLYYAKLNNTYKGSISGLRPEHFFGECMMKVNIKGENDDEEIECSDAINIISALVDLKETHQLFYNPNITADGIKSKTDPHGLLMVVVCGTLHRITGDMVGVFEQSIFIGKDPLVNDWKIRNSLLVMRSNNAASNPPALQPQQTPAAIGQAYHQEKQNAAYTSYTLFQPQSLPSIENSAQNSSHANCASSFALALPGSKCEDAHMMDGSF